MVYLNFYRFVNAFVFTRSILSTKFSCDQYCRRLKYFI